MILDKMLDGVPSHARNRVEATMENIGMMLQVKNPRVATSMIPPPCEDFSCSRANEMTQ